MPMAKLSVNRMAALRAKATANAPISFKKGCANDLFGKIRGRKSAFFE
jgi:hypothetical protein